MEKQAVGSHQLCINMLEEPVIGYSLNTSSPSLSVVFHVSRSVSPFLHPSRCFDTHNSDKSTDLDSFSEISLWVNSSSCSDWPPVIDFQWNGNTAIHSIYVYIGGSNFDECPSMSWQITHTSVWLPLCGFPCILAALAAGPATEMSRENRVHSIWIMYSRLWRQVVTLYSMRVVRAGVKTSVEYI